MTKCTQCHWEFDGTCRANPQVDGKYQSLNLALPSCGKFRQKSRAPDYKREDHILKETVVDIR